MNDSAASQELTQAIKQVARQAGAALVGIAPIGRFDPMPPYGDCAPKGHDPRQFVRNARCVISIAQPIMPAVLDAPAALVDQEMEMIPDDIKYPYLEMLYGTVGHRVHDYMLEFVSQAVEQHLLMQGYNSMFFPTTGIHPKLPSNLSEGKDVSERQIWRGPSKRWAELNSPFRYSFGPFSHRHAATRAGLGEFGYSNVVLTREFGPRQRFNSIITEAPLVPDPIISKPICLRDKCRLCIKACYMDAITLRDDKKVRDYRSVDDVDKSVIFLDTPVKTDAAICTERRDRIPFAPVRGDCIRVCPIPKMSDNLPKRLQSLVEEHRRGEKEQAI